MIFPSRKLVLLSPLPPAQAIDAVKATLKPQPTWRERLSFEQASGFSGTAEDGRFTLQRNINYRNSFLPQVVGKAEADTQTGGSRVTVTLSMHKSVKIFMCIWLWGVGAIGIPLAIAALTHKLQPPQNDWMGAVIPLGMMIFGLCLPHFGFWGKRKKPKFSLWKP